jgi:hypothetical protein
MGCRISGPFSFGYNGILNNNPRLKDQGGKSSPPNLALG